MNFYFFLTACYLFGISFESEAQTRNFKSGRVIDSLTFEPVDLVYVQSVLTQSFAVSNEKGEFQLPNAIGDTLIFSRFGYIKKTVFVGSSAESLSIVLSEAQTTLPVISIYGDFKPQDQERWSEAFRAPKVYDNPTYKPGNLYTMQTLGVGYTLIGPISYFLKSEKEKRKLKKVEQENRQTKIYRMVVSDPETKRMLLKSFSISEKNYEIRLEKFITENPDIVYTKSKDELMDLLFYLFAKK